MNSVCQLRLLVLDEYPDGHWDDEGHEADGDHVVRDRDALVRIIATENVDLSLE